MIESDGYFPTYGAALAAHAAATPDQVALRFGDRITDYRTYDAHATQIASGLAAMGLTKGDRVAYLGRNSDHAVELTLGCARAGMVFVPVIWRLAPAEVDFILGDAGAKVLFHEDEFAAAPYDGPRVSMEREFAAWRDAQSPEPVATEVGAHDPLLQLYTSGTTGLPKGVVLSHHNGTNLRPKLKAAGVYWYSADPGDSMILAMPYGHIAGIGTAYSAVLGGQDLIVHREFDPALLIADVQRHRVKWMFLVPAAINMLLSHPDAAKADFSSVRGLTYGASPIPLDLLKAGVERLKCDFAQLYGMTETFGTVVSLAPEDHAPGREQVMKSAGKPLPGNEVRILDADLNPLPPGQTGEIAIRSESTMLGYWNRPEETAKVMTADGFFKSGDMGFMDERGYIKIVDRKKDMILVSGFNVYPNEIEDVAAMHPGVLESAAIGVADAKSGEVPKLFVVKKDPNLTAEALQKHLRDNLTAYKVPKFIEFRSDLPKTNVGKILRRELRN